MENLRPVLFGVQTLAQRLKERRARWYKQRDTLDAKIERVTATLAALEDLPSLAQELVEESGAKDLSGSPEEEPDYFATWAVVLPLPKPKHGEQSAVAREAAKTVAELNGGLVRSAEGDKFLRWHGIFPDTKRTGSRLATVLAQSDEWETLGNGLFRLMEYRVGEDN